MCITAVRLRHRPGHRLSYTAPLRESLSNSNPLADLPHCSSRCVSHRRIAAPHPHQLHPAPRKRPTVEADADRLARNGLRARSIHVAWLLAMKSQHADPLDTAASVVKHDVDTVIGYQSRCTEHIATPLGDCAIREGDSDRLSGLRLINMQRDTV